MVSRSQPCARIATPFWKPAVRGRQQCPTCVGPTYVAPHRPNLANVTGSIPVNPRGGFQGGELRRSARGAPPPHPLGPGRGLEYHGPGGEEVDHGRATKPVSRPMGPGQAST